MSARYMQPLRILTQFAFSGLLVWLVLCFYNFVQMVSSPNSGSYSFSYCCSRFSPTETLLLLLNMPNRYVCGKPVSECRVVTDALRQGLMRQSEV